MKPYRGTLLAAAMAFATLQLFGCGEADDWKETTSISLSATPTSVELKQLINFTVQSPPPKEGYECETSLQYRAQGAGFDLTWRDVPGAGPTRVFGLIPRRVGTLSVIARGKCAGAKEDWKYSPQVDVEVAAPVVVPPVLPTITSITLTPYTTTPYSKGSGIGISFDLSAVITSGCSSTFTLTASGAGSSPNPNPSPTAPAAVAVGTNTILNINLASAVSPGNALKIIAKGSCTQNPTVTVLSASLDYTIVP